MNAIEKHTISILVDNEFGALGRVIGLFSARGFNLDSLTVSEVGGGISRITVITQGNNDTIRHIITLLERIVPVHRVKDLTISSPHIEREVALVKVIGKDNHIAALQLAERFGAKTVDSTAESFIFELTDTTEKIAKFIAIMADFGLAELSRTGVTALSRGVNNL